MSPVEEMWVVLPHPKKASEAPWQGIHDMVLEAFPMDVLVGIVDHGLNSKEEEGVHVVGKVLALEKTSLALEGDPQRD